MKINPEEYPTYQVLIDTIVKKFPKQERDDLSQNAWEVILTRCNNFDGTNKEDFIKFISLTVRAESQKYMDRVVNPRTDSVEDLELDKYGEPRPSKSFRKTMLHLDDEAYVDENGDSVSYSDLTNNPDSEEDALDAKLTLDVLRANIPDKDYTALELYYLCGYNPREIVESGLTEFTHPKQIYYIINKYKK